MCAARMCARVRDKHDMRDRHGARLNAIRHNAAVNPQSNAALLHKCKCSTH